MTIFDEYKTYTGEVSISPSLLWEYDLVRIKELVALIPNL